MARFPAKQVGAAWPTYRLIGFRDCFAEKADFQPLLDEPSRFGIWHNRTGFKTRHRLRANPLTGRQVSADDLHLPLLRTLRQEQAPFVRPLLSSYCLVRLLIRVHVHLRASAFMNRPGSPYKRRHRMHGVSDCAGPAPCKPFAQGGVLPSL